MILDERSEFADNTSVAAVASTFVVGDVMDLGGTTQDIGTGRRISVVVSTADTEIITGGVAGTIQFFLVSDALSTLGGGVLANCTQHIASGALVTGAAGANDDKLNVGGVIITAELPHGTYERFMGILCTVATTTTTAGSINAFLVNDPAKWVSTADAI